MTRGKNRKLLSVLFALVAFPVVLLLIRSTVLTAAQRRIATEFSARYVRQLARYGASRYSKDNDLRMQDFLDLLNDRGYARLTGESNLRRRREDGESRGDRPGKFIPGMLAYIHADGTLIAASDGAKILPELRAQHPEIQEAVTGVIETDGGKMPYSLCVWPTENPDVFAVALETLVAWGGPMFGAGMFVRETMLTALFCLFVLILLNRVLIRPLRSFSAGLQRTDWGREVPDIDERDGKLFGLQVGEITALREAIVGLAQEAVKKTELEKRYLGDIVKAQEEERNRLAREIHDGPVQVVAALTQRIQMAALEKDQEAVRLQLELAEEAARNVVEDLRGICDSLVPPWVSLGPARCMEEMAARLARHHDIIIDVDIDMFLELPQEQTLALFRIFQEGVSNAVRHGRAKEISLSVSKDEATKKILFLLRDDGAGFDPDSLNLNDIYVSGKRGLTGMRQRAEGLGGTWKMTSAPGAGTMVEITFPAE